MTGGTQPRVSVKTKKEIPKEKIMDCIRQLKDVHADAPVEIGDVLLEKCGGNRCRHRSDCKCKAASVNASVKSVRPF